MSPNLSADDEPNTETLLNPLDVPHLLQEFSEALLERVAENGTTILINGERVKEPFDKILEACTVSPDPDGGFYLKYKGTLIELTIISMIRGRYGAINSPCGTAVLPEWRAEAAILPPGVTIDDQKNAGYKSWEKKTSIGDIEWTENIFESHWRGAPKGKSGEWATAGAPIAKEKMMRMCEIMNKKFSDHSKSLKLEPAEHLHPPGHTMYAYASRQVFVSNNQTLDEGRGSEYVDPFGILAGLGAQADVRYNRVPEVMVRDHVNGKEDAMSFHEIHVLNRASTVFSITVQPRAFQKSVKDSKNTKKCLGWGFKLVNIRIVGKRAPPPISSPQKSVKIRKLVETDFEEPETSKRAKTGAGSRNVN
ncbi:hypothetical protein AAF712_010525 [Marasmius tenuissimus]|uniref:Uncharacterized protein n=1 Tax=Marasmius tenuissimus TaxID=585030 RepID=A0ABR2ZLY9_9AGAR